MSAQSIARWNSIPLTNPNDSSSNTNMKRSQPDEQNEDEDHDDDISLVSRSPSPSHDAMDVDPENLSKYDEYVKGTPREVITVETKIKSSNKGFAMLAKLGWTEGQPLGLSRDGRVDPVPFHIKTDVTGLGKLNQDVRMIDSTVSQRRGLDSERHLKETEDQRRAREDIAARKAALESEINTTLAAFYCQLCSKQFKNVAQYDEHTNSYAHHHKARMKDMAANAKGLKNSAEAEERKEKERKREEKELRKAAKAAGVKMAKPSTGSLLTPVTQPVEGEPKSSGFRKWAAVSVSELPSVQPASATSRGGWASIGSSNSNSATVPSDDPAAEFELDDRWTSAPPLPSNYFQSTAPSFRTGGWTSLDTGSSQPAQPPPQPTHSQPIGEVPPPPPPSSDPSHLSPPKYGFQPVVPVQETAFVRTGWQQFKTGSSKRR